MIDLSSAVAIVALMWTIFQQYQINKMCSVCIFRKNVNINQEVDN